MQSSISRTACPEIFEIADEITILRDGRQVIAGPVSEFDENKVIRHMVGRELNDIFHT